jgi:glycosyltransferase involved in cell wall biosynthesis
VRIAIDARELTGRTTGVGRYLSELLRAWVTLPGAGGHDVILCSPEPIDPARTALWRVTTTTRAGAGTMWEQTVLPGLVRDARADVLFAPAYTGPVFARAPMVLAIHDVSFAAHPEWFGWREGLRRRVITRLSARRAARILTISDFSKREIVRHLGVDQAKVDVIYLGATPLLGPPDGGPHTSPVSRAAASSKAEAAHSTDGGAAARRPFILYVGSLFARRHIPELIAGFGRLARRHPDVRLEIVGDNRSRPAIDVPALAAAAGAADRVVARSYVADRELAALYRGASAFVFLSEYEGFGLTPLEALAAGIPIVVLDTEVAREIYGPAAIYVPSPDAAAIDAALERVLVNGEERARILEAAPQVLARYAWEECARRTLQALLACGT